MSQKLKKEIDIVLKIIEEEISTFIGRHESVAKKGGPLALSLDTMEAKKSWCKLRIADILKIKDVTIRNATFRSVEAGVVEFRKTLREMLKLPQRIVSGADPTACEILCAELAVVALAKLIACNVPA